VCVCVCVCVVCVCVCEEAHLPFGPRPIFLSTLYGTQQTFLIFQTNIKIILKVLVEAKQ